MLLVSMSGHEAELVQRLHLDSTAYVTRLIGIVAINQSIMDVTEQQHALGSQISSLSSYSEVFDSACRSTTISVKNHSLRAPI